MMPPVLDAGLSAIAGDYDAFILDLWGVVHDGQKACPDAIPAMQEMQRAGKSVWLLSNAPRRNDTVVEKLDGMGVTSDLYDGLLTSGEATHAFLEKDAERLCGHRFYFIGQEHKDSSLYDGLSLEKVDDLKRADFLLVSGVRDFSDDAEMYRDVLKEAAQSGMPFICANPDRIVHVADQLVVCAGALADMYEDLGGEVRWFGKPYPAVYRYLQEGALQGQRILAIGDSMVTDIAGAATAGIDSVLVTSGIHRQDLADLADKNRLDSFMTAYTSPPQYIIDRLFW